MRDRRSGRCPRSGRPARRCARSRRAGRTPSGARRAARSAIRARGCSIRSRDTATWSSGPTTRRRRSASSRPCRAAARGGPRRTCPFPRRGRASLVGAAQVVESCERQTLPPCGGRGQQTRRHGKEECCFPSHGTNDSRRSASRQLSTQSSFSSKKCIGPLDTVRQKDDNTRRFPQGSLGVIRFRRDAWRPDCASRILVGLVKKREKL